MAPLLTMAQPPLKPPVGLAQSVVTAVLARSRNKPVYNFLPDWTSLRARPRRSFGTDRSSSVRGRDLVIVA